ncbi:hypothetical protein TNIN_166891 [Trichonephila inaurata madagascariensis]|uniref:Uncharacterized protein n=1 Tax=Trichonephila inaurata madagascariensis TaxID=2747483 RepID=A0A8X6X448_9ARAC|nr:hypothetical protein TNIN_166891 [Trichonephila inaurata madagascariensis]
MNNVYVRSIVRSKTDLFIVWAEGESSYSVFYFKKGYFSLEDGSAGDGWYFRVVLAADNSIERFEEKFRILIMFLCRGSFGAFVWITQDRDIMS